jgi:hypothetical protein
MVENKYKPPYEFCTHIGASCARQMRTFPDLADKLKMPVEDLVRQCNGKLPPSKALVKGQAMELGIEESFLNRLADEVRKDLGWLHLTTKGGVRIISEFARTMRQPSDAVRGLLRPAKRARPLKKTHGCFSQAKRSQRSPGCPCAGLFGLPPADRLLAQHSTLLRCELQPAAAPPVCGVVLQVLQELLGRLATLGNLPDLSPGR